MAGFGERPWLHGCSAAGRCNQIQRKSGIGTGYSGGRQTASLPSARSAIEHLSRVP